jgi:VIT1/CCC1 family predicted Fe2+/Mn2+ transporter
LSFAVGAAMPLLVASIAPPEYLLPATILVSLLSLLCLGALAARAGGASVLTGAVRVTFWSALAMGATALVGSLFGARG